LAAAIENQTGVDAELIRGDSGIFDVVVDGTMIFSKGAEGRFPEEDEILTQLASD
jgi:selT/selW/selH-like putative selenoprotein